MEFIYKNSKGETLNLSQWPYKLQSENIVDYGWSYENINYGSNQSKITSFYKELAEIPLEVAIYSENKESYFEAMNYFFNVIEYDVANGTTGRLYCDNKWYLECYVVGSEKQHWKKDIRITWYFLNIVAENPFWIMEDRKVFRPAAANDSEGLDFARGYPGDFSSKIAADTLINTGHMPVDWRLIIYGPVVNPSINIGKNTYRVYTEIKTDEYLMIDSREHAVAQYDKVGEKTIKYNSRDKRYEIFARVLPGVNSVLWDGNFGFDVITYVKRSEPEWIL